MSCSGTTWSAARHGARRALRPHVGHLPGPLSGGRAARPISPSATSVRLTRINAAETQSLNPNGRYQGNFTRQLLSRLAHGPAPTTSRPACSCRGSGCSTSASGTATYFLELQDGAAVPGAAVEHADQLRPSPEHLGRVPAGPLGGRARDNQRRRAHRRGERAICRRRPARPVPTSRRAASRRPTSSISVRTSRRASASRTTCSATAGRRSRPTTAASTTSSGRRLPKPPTPTRSSTRR